jgi:hypothetical protein
MCFEQWIIFDIIQVLCHNVSQRIMLNIIRVLSHNVVKQWIIFNIIALS